MLNSTVKTGETAYIVITPEISISGRQIRDARARFYAAQLNVVLNGGEPDLAEVEFMFDRENLIGNAVMYGPHHMLVGTVSPKHGSEFVTFTLTALNEAGEETDEWRVAGAVLLYLGATAESASDMDNFDLTKRKH